MIINAMIFMRSASTRLPWKHFRLVGTKPIFEWVVDNIKACNVNNVYINAPDGDDYLVNDKLNDAFTSYIGSDAIIFNKDIKSDNVIGRMKDTVNNIKSDMWLIVSGDCPLIDNTIVNDMIKTLIDNPSYDYVTLPPDHSHIGVDVVRSSAFTKLTDGKHLAMRCYTNLNGIILDSLFTPPKFRGTLDNFADLYFFRECYRLTENLTFKSIAELVTSRPYITKIQSHIGKLSLVHKSKQFLLVTSGDSISGLGHVARTIAHAQTLNEIHGHGIRIIINNNDNARKMLESEGYMENLDFDVIPTESASYKDWDITLNFDKYDAIFIDTPDRCWFDYDIYLNNPRFLTNLRLDYIDILPEQTSNTALVSFGMGKNVKMGERVAKMLDKTNVKYTMNTVTNNMKALLYMHDSIYTMWSQTAREALVLGLTVYVYVTHDNEYDYDLCTKLAEMGKIIFMGRMKECKS